MCLELIEKVCQRAHVDVSAIALEGVGTRRARDHGRRHAIALTHRFGGEQLADLAIDDAARLIVLQARQAHLVEDPGVPLFQRRGELVELLLQVV